MKEGQFEEALEDFNTAIEMQPTYYMAYLGRGRCLMKLSNRHEEAIHDFNEALMYSEDCHQARLYKAACLEELDEWEEASKERSRVPKAVRDQFNQSSSPLLRKASSSPNVITTTTGGAEAAEGQSVRKGDIVDEEDLERYEEFAKQWKEGKAREKNIQDFLHGRRGWYVQSAATKRAVAQRADQRTKLQRSAYSSGSYQVSK